MSAPSPTTRRFAPPLGLGLLWLLSACAGSHLPVTPPHPHPNDDFAQAATARPGIPDDKPTGLLLQPGDSVAVEVVSTSTQSYPDLVLDATGTIHLPLAGDVAIGQLGLTDAEALVVERLKRFDKLVQVNIRVTGYGGQRATVLGAVNAQGSVQLVPGAKVADVIALAGGAITVAPAGGESGATADLSGAVVTRRGAALPVDLERALRGEPAHNVHVRPGDMIYVPPARGTNVSVLGQVGGASVFPHRNGMRLTEALAMAGGVTAGADKHDVRVIRGTLVRPRVYRSSLAELVAGEVHDVELLPGDIVFVTDHWIEDVTEVVNLVAPLLTTTLTATTAAVVLSQ